MSIFGKSTKLLWIAFILAAIVLEVIPANYPDGLFVLQNYWKTGVFLLSGFLTPLAFWRFDHLNAGTLLSIGSIVLVEVVQAVLADGHRFSMMELTIKLLLLAVGFAIALYVRIQLMDKRV